ncbi:hypothetical protein [Marinicrinis sediminis]|uniref:Peptidase S24/S26A/S26B/S26C domain-containing protein n=1 Tax=Marinicrinis sediminis TaxID=1652465 RepID=A0ABW5RES2_9BACL
MELILQFPNEETLRGNMISYYPDFDMIKLHSYPGAIPLDLIQSLSNAEGTKLSLQLVEPASLDGMTSSDHTFYICCKKTGHVLDHTHQVRRVTARNRSLYVLNERSAYSDHESVNRSYAVEDVCLIALQST